MLTILDKERKSGISTSLSNLIYGVPQLIKAIDILTNSITKPFMRVLS
jgi:hypothetical protein